MTITQRIWAALGAIALTILAVVGLGGWWRERRRAGDLGKSAVDLATQNAERAEAQAKADAAAALAHDAAALAASDKKAEEAQDAAVAAGSAGLADTIANRR